MDTIHGGGSGGSLGTSGAFPRHKNGDARYAWLNDKSITQCTVARAPAHIENRRAFINKPFNFK